MLDPFNRTRLPATFDRAGRVRLLGELAEDLLAGRLPSASARMFVAAAISQWLAMGGSLDKALKVVKPKSHMTPKRIWEESQAKRVINMSDSDAAPDEDADAEP